MPGMSSSFPVFISFCLLVFSFFFDGSTKWFRKVKKRRYSRSVVTFFSASSRLIHTHTRTTKMPSDEQQLAEPLLDDGGNDRFVLFPLKYDAVWEMVRRRRRYHFFYFQKSFCFRSVWNLCVCWRSLLSLSLSSYYQLQYKKAQASFWTAGTFYFFFSFVLVSVLLL